MNNINSTIGENMRFVRDFQANPEKYAPAPKQPSANEQMMEMLHPMMMLMLFQMMQRMMPQAPSGFGLPQEAYPPLLPTGMQGGQPYGQSYTQPNQNPALGFLENMLRQKMTANPNATQVELSAADVDSVRQALTQGSMTRPQLGQALMFALDQFSDPHLPAINRLISDLMDSGEVNIAPFLQNDYLERLGSERREMLLMSVERAGLRMDSNRPNARFIGFMLENLARPDAPDTVYTKAFIKQFLQDFYDVHSVDLTTPVGKILSQVLDLGGITTDAEKKLVFP